MATLTDSLKIILGIEAKGFPGVRQQVKGFIQGTQSDLSQLRNMAAGYFTGHFAMELGRSVTEMAGAWKDFAEQADESTQEIQKYDRVAHKVGGSIQELVRFWDALVKKRKEALEGNPDSLKMFQDFGITEDGLRKLDKGRAIFEAIAGYTNGSSDPSIREKFIDIAGDKRGGKFLAMARAMSEGGINPIMTDEQVEAIDRATKQFDSAVLEFKGAAAPLVAALLKWVTVAANFYPDADGSRAFQSSNMERSQTLWGELQDIQDPRGPLSGLGIGKYAYSREQRKQAQSVGAKYFRNLAAGGSAPILTDAQAEEVQIAIASIKKGLPIPDPSAPAYGPPVSGRGAAPKPISAVGTPPSKFTEIQNRRLADVMDAAFLQLASPDQQKTQLRAQIARDLGQADKFDKVGLYKDAAEMRLGSVKDAVSLAKLNEIKPHEWKADQLAAVGGFIGGAAAGIDPSLAVQMDMRQLLREILNQYPALAAALRERDKNIGNPINDVH